MSTNTVVWTEIPVTDMDKAVAFYSTVFGWDMTVDTTGPNPMVNFAPDTGGVHGHLYPGTPARDGAGPSLHLAVPGTVEDAMARCFDAGGNVISEVITIPPGRFAYATDPDGNSIGLFEAT